METDNPNSECGNYRLNINKEDLINNYAREWVLEWCKKYHPEAWEEADKFIRGQLKGPSSSVWPRNSSALDWSEEKKKTP